jgi:starch phosphorylase
MFDYWSQLRFVSVRIKTAEDYHRFDVQVLLNEMDPDAIQVEFPADGFAGGEPIRRVLVRG